MNHSFDATSRRGLTRFGALSVSVLAAAFVSACAGMPPPTDDMALSSAAVAHATSAGATELAPTEMRSARDKLDRAKLAMTAKDYASAQSLAREAQVEAQLAEATADSTKARKAAEALREDTRVLREELDRKNK